MSTIDVLAAAVVLREFDAASLASFAEEAEPQVESVLDCHRSFFNEVKESWGPRRWRVREVGDLRAYLQVLSSGHRTASADLAIGEMADPRLGYVEEILAECVRAADDRERWGRIPTAFSLTYQCAFEALRWTDAGRCSGPTWNDLPPLVRINLLLVNLARYPNAWPKRRYLRVAREDLSVLAGRIAEDRRRQLESILVFLTQRTLRELRVDLRELRVDLSDVPPDMAVIDCTGPLQVLERRSRSELGAIPRSA